jgi:Alba
MKSKSLRLLKEKSEGNLDPSIKVIIASRKSHIKDLITQAESIIQDPSQILSVKILGCEDTITKAITVAEIIKRKYSVIQKTEIYKKDFKYSTTSTDDLEEDIIVKKKSCISIELKRTGEPS